MPFSWKFIEIRALTILPWEARSVCTIEVMTTMIMEKPLSLSCDLQQPVSPYILPSKVKSSESLFTSTFSFKYGTYVIMLKLILIFNKKLYKKLIFNQFQKFKLLKYELQPLLWFFLPPILMHNSTCSFFSTWIVQSRANFFKFSYVSICMHKHTYPVRGTYDTRRYRKSEKSGRKFIKAPWRAHKAWSMVKNENLYSIHAFFTYINHH